MGEYQLDEIRCRVCRRVLKKENFESTFSGNLHYKTTKCSCGKEVNIPVNFSGSGKDEWKGDIEKGKGEEESIEMKLCAG